MPEAGTVLGAKAPIINPPELKPRYVDVNNMPWEAAGPPGSERKILYEDKATGMQTWLVRMAPGGVIPFHEHPEIEQTFVLEGSLVDDEGECTAGNFVWRPGKSRHIARCPNGALFLVVFMKPTRRLNDDGSYK
jgi:anti-sigma factor ChrR (cupin superfamily)